MDPVPVSPLSPPQTRAPGVLRYAEAPSGDHADLRSADREMTWRLARTNGWGATVVGGFATFAFAASPWSRPLPGVAVALVPLLAILAPGLALMAAWEGARAGRRDALVTAMVGGAWLACVWGVAAGLFGVAGVRTGDLLSMTAPTAIMGCLLVPAAMLVYHAVRVLALGGRGGWRDKTSGLDTAAPATDADLWRFAGRIALLHLAAGTALLALSAACLAGTLWRPAPPPLPGASGTPFKGDLYAEDDGLPRHQRRAAADALDRGGWRTAGQRHLFDDLLREAGARIPTPGSGFGWDQFTPAPAPPTPELPARRQLPPGPYVTSPLAAEWEFPGVVSICWLKDQPRVVVRSGRYDSGIWGDVFEGLEGRMNRPWVWSLGAMERWALRHAEAGGGTPTVEQILAVRTLIPQPQRPRPGQSPLVPVPTPVLPPFEAAALEDGTLRVHWPGAAKPTFVDADGSAHDTPRAQRAAEAAAVEVPPPLPVWPASPALLVAVAAAAVVAAGRAWSRSRRGRAGGAAFTRPVAGQLLNPLAVLGVGSLVALALNVAAAAHAEVLQPRQLFSPQAGVLAVAACGWVAWTAVVLPRRAVALARGPRQWR